MHDVISILLTTFGTGSLDCQCLGSVLHLKPPSVLKLSACLLLHVSANMSFLNGSIQELPSLWSLPHWPFLAGVLTCEYSHDAELLGDSNLIFY